jgi:tripartite motif-containing protein 71
MHSIGFGLEADYGRVDCILGLAVSRGLVFVVDSNNHRVSVFSANGSFVRVIGSKGSGNGELQYPTGVAVVADHLFVTNKSHCVSVFKHDGCFVRVFPRDESGDGELARLLDRLYVECQNREKATLRTI